jgi:hypothetical protein
MSRWPYRYLPGTTVEELRKELERALKASSSHTKSGRVIRARAAPKSPRVKALEVLEIVNRHLDELGVDHTLTKPLADYSGGFPGSRTWRVASSIQDKNPLDAPADGALAP